MYYLVVRILVNPLVLYWPFVTFPDIIDRAMSESEILGGKPCRSVDELEGVPRSPDDYFQ